MTKNHSTYRIPALLMAFIMLLTSVGFTVDMHYCQGKLKSFNLLGKAKKCHELQKTQTTCPHHQKINTTSEVCLMDAKDCCENKTQHFQLDQDQQAFSPDLLVSSPLQYFVIAYVEVFIKRTVIDTKRSSFADYRSPIISRDIYVLFESFLL